jgi:hypothetical protein
MLEGASVLLAAGVPIEALVELGKEIGRAVDGIAAGYVRLLNAHVFGVLPDPLPAADVPRLAELVRRLRPLARAVVDAELAHALERRIQAEVGQRLARAHAAGSGSAAAS